MVYGVTSFPERSLTVHPCAWPSHLSVLSRWCNHKQRFQCSLFHAYLRRMSWGALFRLYFNWWKLLFSPLHIEDKTWVVARDGQASTPLLSCMLSLCFAVFAKNWTLNLPSVLSEIALRWLPSSVIMDKVMFYRIRKNWRSWKVKLISSARDLGNTACLLLGQRFI